MKNPANKKSQPSVVEAKRPIDIFFAQYSENHQNPTNRLIHWICVPLALFSLFGLLWAIPFPHLKFLGSYNGFFNWASFLIAFSIYYYYKLSPMLSYAMLMVLMAFSYGVTQLVAWQTAGGPALWLVCSVVFVLAGLGQFAGKKMEGKRRSFADDLKSLLLGPIWLLHIIFKKFSIRY